MPTHDPASILRGVNAPDTGKVFHILQQSQMHQIVSQKGPEVVVVL